MISTVLLAVFGSIGLTLVWLAYIWWAVIRTADHLNPLEQWAQANGYSVYMCLKYVVMFGRGYALVQLEDKSRRVRWAEIWFTWDRTTRDMRNVRLTWR